MANQQSDENNKIAHGSEETKVPVAVVMVPLTAQGHLNQLLHLSRLISAYKIPIHFVSTTAHSRQAKARIHGWNPLSVPNMFFHDFPIPPFTNVPPDPNSTIKFPHQLLPLFKSLTNLREPVYALTQKLSQTARKIVVIYDSLMGYVVQDIRSITNAEAYCFQSISAFSLYASYWEMLGKPALTSNEAETALNEVPSFEGCYPPEFMEIAKLLHDAPKFNSGDIYNTSRVIDGLYIDLFAEQKLSGVDKVWAIGPFNPVTITKEKESDGRNRILDWLDKQEERSVLFVSFGTTSSISDEQIHEIAIGLEKSEHKFIWVLRDADKGNVFDGEVRNARLPEGYEERLEGRGIIVRDWAPQLEILGHDSTGAFISHCGWNSCIESISMGKPVGTWPMHSDQPRNAVLITKVLKIGTEVRDWACRNEVLSAMGVQNAVRKLMGSDGEEIRKRAAEIGVAVRKSVEEGGVSRKEMDSFIHHLTRC